MKAILSVGTAHDLYNKVVEVELTGHKGIRGSVEVITTEEHDLHYNILKYNGNKVVEEIPMVSTQKVTAWAKTIIEE